MKCLSLWNPWAYLMSIGKKQFETRSWATSYRGPLAIHAAKKWNKTLLEICYKEPFYTTLYSERPNQAGCFYFDEMLKVILPFGAIVAVVDLYACRLLTKEPLRMPSGVEFSFGDYSEGRYVWQTTNLKRLVTPILYRGKQGLFDIPDELLRGAKYAA